MILRKAIYYAVAVVALAATAVICVTFLAMALAAALKPAVGEAWAGVLVAGAAALLAGGAVAGGRVAGDWPGLGRTQLNEGRDLRATTDLRAVFKGVLMAHLGLSESALESKVFPDSGKAKPVERLVHTARATA